MSFTAYELSWPDTSSMRTCERLSRKINFVPRIYKKMHFSLFLCLSLRTWKDVIPECLIAIHSFILPLFLFEISEIADPRSLSKIISKSREVTKLIHIIVHLYWICILDWYSYSFLILVRIIYFVFHHSFWRFFLLFFQIFTFL